MFLTGPQIVEAVTREKISAEDLGGPKVHSHNGVAHLQASGDVEAAELTRAFLSHLPSQIGDALPLYPPRAPLADDPSETVPDEPRRVYDVRDVIARLVDGGELLELGPRWARNLVVGFARIEGSPVGVIANQPRHLGGCLDAAASEKGAWFVNMCDRFGLPLVGALRHAGVPAGCNPGAGWCNSSWGFAATSVCHRHRPARDRYASPGVRRRTHRHELT